MVLLATFGGSLSLSGCGVPIGLYHSAEGGAIAQARQPPPGADAPYPNLAAVPAEPAALSPAARAAAVRVAAGAEAAGGVSAPSPAALAGLSLPGAPPPAPDVPDLVIPRAPAAVPKEQAQTPETAVTARARPPSAPVSLAFERGSAVLDPQTAVALQAIAAAAAGSNLLVGGFGESDGLDAPALTLALARAARLADALTAAGVPASAIRLVAMPGGSGGFVQLFY